MTMKTMQRIFWTIFCLVALFMIFAVVGMGWLLTSIDYSHGLSGIVDTIWNGTNAN